MRSNGESVMAWALAALWTAAVATAASDFAPASASEQRQWAPFVLVATQRTGSRWIMETFKYQTCDIDPADTEIFDDKTWCVDRNNDQHNQRSSCVRNLTLMREGLAAVYDPARPVSRALQENPHYFGEVMRSRGKREPEAYGVKWMTNQGMDEIWSWFLELAKARGIKLLFLHRRDYLRMAVSRLHMQDPTLVAHPHHEHDAQKIRDTPVTLPTGDRLIKLLDLTRNKFGVMNDYRAAADAAGVLAKNLVYEDMGPEKFASTKRWLVKGLNLTASSCDPASLRNESKSVVIHNAPIRTYVANWAAVAATLRGTRYARFLQDDARRLRSPPPPPRVVPAR